MSVNPKLKHYSCLMCIFGNTNVSRCLFDFLSEIEFITKTSPGLSKQSLLEVPLRQCWVGWQERLVLPCSSVFPNTHAITFYKFAILYQVYLWSVLCFKYSNSRFVPLSLFSVSVSFLSPNPSFLYSLAPQPF